MRSPPSVECGLECDVRCCNVFVSRASTAPVQCATPDTFLERDTIGKSSDSRTLYLCFCQQSGECPGFRDTSTCISVSLLYITFIFLQNTPETVEEETLVASFIVYCASLV